MKIDITFTSVKHYSFSTIGSWFFIFKKYKNIEGFILRIFGVYINVRENNATEKLIAKARQMP